jgi:hypothetical protein
MLKSHRCSWISRKGNFVKISTNPKYDNYQNLTNKIEMVAGLQGPPGIYPYMY